ncbi:MAG: c-type cytochrome [Roseiflexaceae bacterium]
MRRRNTWRAKRLALGVSVIIVVGCGSLTLRGPSEATPTAVILPVLDPNQVVRGRQVYAQNCARCHGQQAEGAPNWQQPDARGDLPPPPHDDSGHTWRHSDAQLTEIIRQGLRDRFNKTPELTMPPFKGQLTDEEIAAVITYFKSLWSPEHQAYQEEENRRPPMPTQRSGP